MLDQQAIEADSLVAQWIALVHADHHRRQALDVVWAGEARPSQRIARAEGLNAIGHGAPVVVQVQKDAVVLGRGRVLR